MSVNVIGSRAGFRLVLALLVAATPLTSQAGSEAQRENRLAWWREARFGMFIHWGLYAVPAGEWKGQHVKGLGEWIMNRAKIPGVEYEQLAKQFNPVKFDADAWVAVAKNAGMKYIVITAKHHDGFAMFGSKVSKYNIVDATPFHRDPMKELAAACQKAGIRLCFYYSQTQDWHEPDAAGNTWDFPVESKKNFAKYFEDKVKPQVRELLTGYGPIGLIWFDTPRNLSSEESHALADLVHQLQPDCLVSGRVGNGAGDYDSAGDNQISVGKVRREWETPVTMNDTWGFKNDDQNWKTPAVLIQQLVKTVSRGGNYLLNVGPTSEGLMPQPSIERLAAVGRWMQTNGDSIYGSSPDPFPYDLPWGVLTIKPGKLYLHILDWPRRDFALVGLKSKVERAYLLADPHRKPLSIRQAGDQLRIVLPAAAPDPGDSVIALNSTGSIAVETGIMQQPDRTLTLPASLAEVHLAPSGPHLKLDSRGVAEGWVNKDEWMSWTFTVFARGTFDLTLISSEQKYGAGWQGGHKIKVNVDKKALSAAVANDGRLDNPSNPYWPYVISKLGRVHITNSGEYTLTLKPETLVSEKPFGLTLVYLKLTPAIAIP